MYVMYIFTYLFFFLDAKKVAQTPPSKTFYGKSIQFRTEPLNKGKLVHTESVPDEMSSSMAVSSKGKLTMNIKIDSILIGSFITCAFKK